MGFTRDILWLGELLFYSTSSLPKKENQQQTHKHKNSKNSNGFFWFAEKYSDDAKRKEKRMVKTYLRYVHEEAFGIVTSARAPTIVDPSGKFAYSPGIHEVGLTSGRTMHGAIPSGEAWS